MTSWHDNTREHVFFFCFLDSEKTTGFIKKINTQLRSTFPVSLCWEPCILHLFFNNQSIWFMTLTALFYLPYLPSFVSTEWSCSDLGSKLSEALATHWYLTSLGFVCLEHLVFSFDTNCSKLSCWHSKLPWTCPVAVFWSLHGYGQMDRMMQPRIQSLSSFVTNQECHVDHCLAILF